MWRMREKGGSKLDKLALIVLFPRQMMGDFRLGFDDDRHSRPPLFFIRADVLCTYGSVWEN
jgi:hypothetical protein